MWSLTVILKFHVLQKELFNMVIILLANYRVVRFYTFYVEMQMLLILNILFMQYIFSQ